MFSQFSSDEDDPTYRSGSSMSDAEPPKFGHDNRYNNNF